MTQSKALLKRVAFDAARYLDDDDAIAEHVAAAHEVDVPDLVLRALSNAGRAKDVTQVAMDTALGRKRLSKALAPGAKSRLEIVMKVVRALFIKFVAQPLRHQSSDFSARS